MNYLEKYKGYNKDIAVVLSSLFFTIIAIIVFIRTFHIITEILSVIIGSIFLYVSIKKVRHIDEKIKPKYYKDPIGDK